MSNLSALKKFFLPAMLLGTFSAAFAQPTSLTLQVKLRDFREVVNGNNFSHAQTHPDFNNDQHLDCGVAAGGVRGYVNQGVDSLDNVDANFQDDNRGPALRTLTRPSNGQACYTSFARFDEWFNDKQGVNRPFYTALTFNRVAATGRYEYINSSFFPMDNGNVANLTPVFGGADATPFGHLNNTHGGADANHNFGFTMEFHANFTYERNDGQIFTFTGDDDVWVYIDGILVIDMGGLHSAITQSVNLDTVGNGRGRPLVDGESYKLDFFFAERHTEASNCRITTSIYLSPDPPKVATPTMNPPSRTFTSSVPVLITTVTPGAIIYYTVNGATPDSNSTRYVDGTPIQVIGTTTLKAIAYKPGWQPSDVRTETYTKSFVASTVEILDANGNPLQGGYLTELNTSYTVRVTTSQAGLTTLSPTAVTKTATDNETLTLSNPTPGADRFIFSGPVAFSIAVKAANGKTEASTYDSLTVRWVNPQDPNDIALKSVLVRPAPKQARAYFSTDATGTSNTTQFAGNETVIYLIVEDQVLPGGVQPKATLVTRPAVGGSTPDNETFNLVAIPGKPGFLVATIPVGAAGAAVANDGTLRLANADQIVGTYQDPVDTESPATANAGYGAPATIDASLQFTDASFNVLPGGSYWSPAEGKLYLQLKDDWVDGTIPTKEVTLSIVNNNGLATADAEKLNVTLVIAKKVGTTGFWEGSINLKDLLAITPNNGTAETYILGNVTATVTSHTNTGTVGDAVTDNLLVAYKDEGTKVTLEDSDGPGTTIGRVTDGLIVKVTDQSLTSGTDTLTVTLKCSQSGDNLVVKVVEVSPGVYQSQVIPKNEAGAAADGILSCKDKDIIRATVEDPVYKTGGEISVTIDDPVITRITYMPATGPETAIGSVQEGDATSFKVVVDAVGKNVNTVDSVLVLFTTLQGEREAIWAVETDKHSQKFVAIVPIAFVTANPLANNQTVEGRITAKEIDNRVTATGTVAINGTETKKDIVLIAAYVPVVKAWITDQNGDGAGDHVYVQFQKSVGRLPSSLEAQWNTEAVPFKSLSGAKLSFNADSTILIADFSGSQFADNLTSVPAGSTPKAKLPADPLFAGQTPTLEDSIGPVIIKATKSPADVNTLKPNDPSFNLDTLRITVSEPLKSGEGLKDMLKFSTSCGDYANAKTVIASVTPSTEPSPPAEPNTYLIIVDNSGATVPLTGNCVFLNSDPAKVTDLSGNKPPKTGNKLIGADRQRIIQLFRGFPPVAGLDPTNPTYQVAVQDSRDPNKGGYANQAGVVLWIPPVGFDATEGGKDKKFVGYVPKSPKDQATGDQDPTRMGGIPAWISAVQVISTSKYVARVIICDNIGNVVRKFSQSFGYQGEMGNVERVVPKGLVSYLVWDMKDEKGQMAGQGAYVWKVVFTFETGKQEIMYTKTGVMRLTSN